MVSIDDIKQLVGEVLQIGDRVEQFDRSTSMLGSIPEFDSMAVVSVITALEERFDIIVEDDEIGAETFETLGNLYDFVVAKTT